MVVRIRVAIGLFVIAFTLALVGIALFVADSNPRDWTRYVVWLPAAAIPLAVALAVGSWSLRLGYIAESAAVLTIGAMTYTGGHSGPFEVVMLELVAAIVLLLVANMAIIVALTARGRLGRLQSAGPVVLSSTWTRRGGWALVAAIALILAGEALGISSSTAAAFVTIALGCCAALTAGWSWGAAMLSATSHRA